MVYTFHKHFITSSILIFSLSSYNGQVDMTFHQLVYDVSSTHGAPPTVITKPGSEYAQKKVSSSL